jgi:hypothetical protein
MPPPALAVIVDGTLLPEEEARAVWDRFSTHMDAHAGDLAGFAKAEGFASVHPTAEGGRAVLRISRTDAQRPYGERGSTGGSGPNQGLPGGRNKTRRSSPR